MIYELKKPKEMTLIRYFLYTEVAAGCVLILTIIRRYDELMLLYGGGMNIYLVSRTDKISYCEDMQSIVVASDEMWAEKLARLDSDDFRRTKLSVKQIDISKEGVLLTTNMGA